MPKEIIVNKVNIHYVVQLLIFDFVMVYLLRIGFALDKIETEKIEDARRKEMENQYNAMRARSTV
jgi:hydrogenase maturation factor